MADLFRDRSCMHWWLPNDERYPTIVRSIRRFVEERTAPARDVPSEDLRDMKAIFSSLKLDDGKSSQPSTSQQSKMEADNPEWPGPDIGVEHDDYELDFNEAKNWEGGGRNPAFRAPRQGEFR